jgi:hypothetical protein
MARLETTLNSGTRGYTCFEVRPIHPVTYESVDTYGVRLWVHNQLVYDRVHSVRHLQMRHYYVELIAHALCNPYEYLGKEIQFSPDSELEPQAGFVPTALACVHLEADWMTIVLSAAQTKRFGNMVHMNIYLKNSVTTIGDIERGRWGEYAEMTWAIILCRPEDAVAFGQQLRAEIREVEKQRIELGIPEYDDDSPEN